MGKKVVIFLFLTLLGMVPCVVAGETGLVPVPVLKEINIQAHIVFDPRSALYTYTYSIANPVTNTGNIWNIEIDISQSPNSTTLSSEGLTIPRGMKTETFAEIFNRRKNPMPVVPVGVRVPPLWRGNITVSGTVEFVSGTGSPLIRPREKIGGFEIISRGIPAIREIKVKPWWIYSIDGFVTDEDSKRARELEVSLPFKTKTIGPSAPPADFKPVEFLDYIISLKKEAYNLGWIVQGRKHDREQKEDEEKGIMRSLDKKLDIVRESLVKGHTRVAREILEAFIFELAALHKKDHKKEDRDEDEKHREYMTTEAFTLLKYNAQYLIEKLGEEKREHQEKKD